MVDIAGLCMRLRLVAVLVAFSVTLLMAMYGVYVASHMEFDYDEAFRNRIPGAY